MPIAKRKLDRVKQVKRWLEHAFPAQRPVRLVIRDLTPIEKKLLGYVSYGATLDTLYLHSMQPLYVMLATLLHEWAHVLCREEGLPPRQSKSREPTFHSALFWQKAGAIEVRFLEAGGVKESGSF